MCQLLKALRDEYSAEFCYICHLRADVTVPLYFRLRGIRMQIRRPDAPGLPDAYRDLDLHVCQMMHSSILSLRAGVPTVNLGYDIKNAALFDMLGLSEFCLQADNLVPSRVLAAVGKLLANKHTIMGRTSAAIEGLKRTRDAFFLELVRTMSIDPKGG
jgi:polysaccharide pyruvyl transferase WcaK-like protein